MEMRTESTAGIEMGTESTAGIHLSKFVIEPDEAAAMMAAAGAATAEELLPGLVPAAQRLARPPISRFNVGAVGLGASGRIYVGVNVEFAGLPLHHSIHAEQFLLVNAAAHGETAIRRIAVSAAPCGHCRQYLQELRGASAIPILVTVDGAAAAYRPLSDLLPRPFVPRDLLDEGAALLLEPHVNELGEVEEAAEAAGELERRLRAAAEEAARAAHAPYSGCAAGFAVADGEGAVHAGAYAESAAFNPSVGPVQAAVVAYMVAGGAEVGGIKAAALVEEEGAAVVQEATARAFLSAVAPGAHLSVYRFRR